VCVGAVDPLPSLWFVLDFVDLRYAEVLFPFDGSLTSRFPDVFVDVIEE